MTEGHIYKYPLKPYVPICSYDVGPKSSVEFCIIFLTLVIVFIFLKKKIVIHAMFLFQMNMVMKLLETWSAARTDVKQDPQTLFLMSVFLLYHPLMIQYTLGKSAMNLLEVPQLLTRIVSLASILRREEKIKHPELLLHRFIFWFIYSIVSFL